MSQQTPLYQTHLDLKARMVDFGGWDMPVQYSSIRAEHLTVRQHVGLFDISHMGEIWVRGAGAWDAVQHLSCNDLNKLKPQQCQYSALLTENGTFVDDIIIYPISAEDILICVNAGNTDKDFTWIQEHTPDNISVSNESADWCQLAVQGPQAQALMTNIFGAQVTPIKRFYFEFIEAFGSRLLISRTGYTGEDGYEIYGPAKQALTLWEALMEAGQKYQLAPCGLGARDTLRLEACYPLYGHEIDEQTQPFEAGLGWIVAFKEPGFIGQAALSLLKGQTPPRTLIAFQLEERGIARQGYTICDGDQVLGQVVSGTLSPSLQQAIGLGYVPTDYAQVGTKIAIDIRGKKRNAAVVSKPFYRNC